jgi:hypothetical protein
MAEKQTERAETATVPPRPDMGAASQTPPKTLRIATTLRLGERVLVGCEDGMLVAEYVLFDAGEVVLHATDPVTVREAGYITTAQDALERLAFAGVTPQLARDAARAMGPEVVRSFARGSAAIALADRLGPGELFDGAFFRPTTQHYEGAWLDLRAVSVASGVVGAALALQALYLASALEEVSGETPVHLSTAAFTRSIRPGERTYRVVALDMVRAMPDALGRVQPERTRSPLGAERDRLLREALLARVRERATNDASPELRAHLDALAGALAVDSPPPGPLADPALWAIERQLASGDARGISDRLNAIEAARGPSPAVRYLRARAALIAGEVSPRQVAQLLSEVVDEQSNFHEAELVAARAWLAAGEEAHARYFARRVAEDPAARDSVRIGALDILDATTTTKLSQAPPPVSAAPALGARMPSPRPSPPEPSFVEAPPGASLPPVVTVPPQDPAPPAVRPSAGPPSLPYDPEIVEALTLPSGATDYDLPIAQRPTTPLQARVAMTRQARSLARDYRLWYGTTLRCNVMAIDAMQRHLTQRFAGAVLTDTKIAAELQRHGALLSEIMARALAAEWVDLAPTEPGYWAMLVPPATRCWPVGRVYRYVAMGHREKDLVSFYLDLEARARPA